MVTATVFATAIQNSDQNHVYGNSKVYHMKWSHEPLYGT